MKLIDDEQDTFEVGRRLKCKESIFLNYPNYNMDAWPIVEMRARLIFLFRVLKVDTVIVYDPSSLYERNPDHTVGAKAVGPPGTLPGGIDGAAAPACFITIIHRPENDSISNQPSPSPREPKSPPYPAIKAFSE